MLAENEGLLSACFLFRKSKCFLSQLISINELIIRQFSVFMAPSGVFSFFIERYCFSGARDAAIFDLNFAPNGSCCGFCVYGKPQLLRITGMLILHPPAQICVEIQ